MTGCDHGTGQVTTAGFASRDRAPVGVGPDRPACDGAMRKRAEIISRHKGVSRRAESSWPAMPWHFRGVDAREPDAMTATVERVAVYHDRIVTGYAVASRIDRRFAGRQRKHQGKKDCRKDNQSTRHTTG